MELTMRFALSTEPATKSTIEPNIVGNTLREVHSLATQNYGLKTTGCNLREAHFGAVRLALPVSPGCGSILHRCEPDTKPVSTSTARPFNL
jgi:hypothetical protein